jgi:hypothetical protein
MFFLLFCLIILTSERPKKHVDPVDPDPMRNIGNYFCMKVTGSSFDPKCPSFPVSCAEFRTGLLLYQINV